MWSKKRSWFIILLVGFITIFCLFQLPRLAYDYDLNKLFPIDDPQTEFFKNFQHEFENDNDYILIGLPYSESIFETNYLIKVQQLTEYLNSIDAIVRVRSLSNTKFRKRLSFSSRIFESPIVHISQPARYNADSVKIFNDEFLIKYLVAQDARSSLIYIQHKENLDEPACRALSVSISDNIKKIGFNKWHIAGKCYGQTYFVDLVQQEMTKFIIGSVVLIIVFLYIFFRNLVGIILPLLIVGLSVLWTVGWMSWIEKPLDIISNVLPTFLLIIGVSHVVHFLIFYIQQLESGRIKTKALSITIKEIGFAILLTTLTTIIGFITLATSSFSSLVDLGKYAVVGLTISFALTYTLLPSILTLIPVNWDSKKLSSGWLSQAISSSYDWVNQNEKKILIISIAIFLVSVVGVFFMRADNYILDGVKDSNPQKQSFNFFEDHYGGARSFELVVTLKDTSLSIFDLDVLDEIQKIDNYLNQEYGTNNLISPVGIIKAANKIYNQGKSRFFRIPQNQYRINTITDEMMKSTGEESIRRYIGADHKKARISGMMPDIGSRAATAKNKNLNKFLHNEDIIKYVNTQITGTPHLIDLNMTYLSKNVLYSLLAAIAIIGLIFGFMSRSIKLAFLILIPNILPLVFIAGIMGYFRINLNLSTAIIFIISFSIAVDDSIHFISRFRSLIQHNDLETALKLTYISTGQAITVTSVVLSSGFFILCISDFLGTFYVGLLVGITLLTAMVADLTLLPILIKRYYSKN